MSYSIRKTKISRYCTILIFLLTLLTVSCDKFMDVGQPNSQMSKNEVFLEMGTATAAMTDIYSRIRDAGLLAGNIGGQSLLLGVYTDELKFYGSTQSTSSIFYSNNIPATNSAVAGYWNNAYSQIFAANSIIEGVGSSLTLPKAGKEQLIGEALFVRALLHSYLCGVFGEVPYIKGTDPEANKIAPKIPVPQVLSAAKGDLEAAIILLPEAYVKSNRVRPNLYAAKALLARICLEKGDYEQSDNAASAVISNTVLYPYNNNLATMFLKESTSTIWQLSPGSPTGNSGHSVTFIFNIGPPPAEALSEELLASFTVRDQRKSVWTRAIVKGSNTWYHAYKYKQGVGTTVQSEFSIMLRLGELYLIRAEARARAGFFTAAKDDLDKIRHTAGLGDSTAENLDELLDAILAERRVELFTEQGHRFYDLKRFGKLDAALSPIKPGWNTTDARLPIPEAELNLNPLLSPQNLGY